MPKAFQAALGQPRAKPWESLRASAFQIQRLGSSHNCNPATNTLNNLLKYKTRKTRMRGGRGEKMATGNDPLRINTLTETVIGAAIEVHRQLGPGLLESAYRKCLAYELRKRGHEVVEEQSIPIIYDGQPLDCGFRADLFVDQLVVVELKAKSTILPIDKAQTLSHLRLLDLPVGLLLNFHEVKLIDGLHRIVNDYQGPKPS